MIALMCQEAKSSFDFLCHRTTMQATVFARMVPEWILAAAGCTMAQPKF